MTLSDKLRKALRSKSKIVWQLEPRLLLCPNVPKPLHGVAPRSIMGSKWWNATRKAAYKSTDYHCKACGISKFIAEYRQWLEGHEVYKIDYLLGRAEYMRTVPLCHLCHNYIHSGRMQALLEQGKVSHRKFAAVQQHGDRVLATISLKRPETYAGLLADWKDWRLLFNGKEYPPLYKNEKAWQKAMEKQ